MLCVILVVGTAMAGTIKFTGSGTPLTIALEAMNAARTYTLPSTGSAGPNTASITITPSTSLASSNLLTVTFTNAGFIGDNVALCAVGTQIPLAITTSTANSTSILFQLTSGSAASTQIFLTDDPLQVLAGSGNCILSSAALTVHLLPVSSASLATVTYTDASAGNTTIDAATAASTVANIAPQFATAYGTGSSTIDYIGGAANGSQFTGTVALNTDNPGTANIVYTAMQLTAAGTTLPSASLTVSAILSLQDSASWAGVKDVYATGNACGVPANSVVVSGANNLTGTVNLAIPAAAFNGTASYLANVCVDVFGNSVLSARTLTGSYNVVAYTHTPDAYKTIGTWTPNGYVGVIPYLNGNSAYDTICIVSNQGAGNAAVKFSALADESGASVATLQGIAVATLAPSQTLRLDITNVLQPYTYSSGTEAAGTPISLAPIASNDRFTGQINISASPSTVTVTCIQTDTLAGVKRTVPILQNNTSTGLLLQ